MGADASSNPSVLRSLHRLLGIVVLIADILDVTSSGETAPRANDETCGCPRQKSMAAAERGTE